MPRKDDTMKPVPVPEMDMDGSRPGIQSGPSKGDVAWMATRRAAKFTTSVAVGVIVAKCGGSITEAIATAGGYMAGEKAVNETVHGKTGKHADVDPFVIILELIKKLYQWIRSR